MRALLRHSHTGISLRRAWLHIAAFAIACQFLVPAGYMPGSFADGTPFVLCAMHTAVSAPAMDTAQAHHEHGQHEEHTGAEAWEHCPLGALSAGTALASSFAPALDSAGTEQDFIAPAAIARSVAILTAQARAPPVRSLNLFA